MKKIKYLLVGVMTFCLFGITSVNAYNQWSNISSYNRVDQIIYDCTECVGKAFPYDTHTFFVRSNYEFNDNYYFFANDFFVLDLQGKTLTNKNTEDGKYKTLFEIGNNAKLTIIDSVGGGKIEGGILVAESGTLIINGGTIGHSDLDGAGIIVNGGTVTINGGTLIGSDYGLSVDVASNKNINLEINGGTFSGGIAGLGLKAFAPTPGQTLLRKLEINGGAFSGSVGGLHVLDQSTLPKISNGNFISTGLNNYGGILIIKKDSISFNPNDLLITDSKFSNSSFEEKEIGDSIYYASDKSINVYKKHSIDISEEIINGSVTANIYSEYCGETITLTTMPNAGYQVKSIKILNRSSTDVTDLVGYNATNKTFTMPDYDITIIPEFKLVPVTTYTITLNLVTGVSFDKISPITVESGDNEQITIIADTGYRLTSVKVNNVEKLPLTDNKLIITDITEDKEVVVTVEKIEYDFTDGNGQKYTVGKDKDAVFKINANKSLFSKVYLDNEELDSEHYIVTEGSTIITLKQDFLSGLLIGKHDLRVTFTDGGESNTTFVIAKPIEENPKTGDSIMISIILGSVALIGLLVVGIYIIKKKKN